MTGRISDGSRKPPYFKRFIGSLRAFALRVDRGIGAPATRDMLDIQWRAAKVLPLIARRAAHAIGEHGNP
jgi:hypothetical protein